MGPVRDPTAGGRRAVRVPTREQAAAGLADRRVQARAGAKRAASALPATHSINCFF